MPSKERFIGIALLLPALILFITLMVYPIASSLRYSLLSFKLFLPEDFVGLENYRTIFEPDFVNSLRITLFYVSVSLLLQLLIGLGIALLLNTRIKGKAVFRTLFLIPIFVAPVASAVAWRWLLAAEVGTINYFISLIGLKPPLWFVNPTVAIFTIIVTDTWIATPFIIMVLSAGLLSIPEELNEAAIIDGASRFQLFRNVTLPLLKPAFLAAILIRTMEAFKGFDTVFVLTWGGPMGPTGPSTELLSMHIYKEFARRFSVGPATAYSMVLTLVVAVISITYIRLLRVGR